MNAEFYCPAGLVIQLVLKKTYSDDPEEDSQDAPTLW